MDLYTDSYLDDKERQSRSKYYTKKLIMEDENTNVIIRYIRRNRIKLLVAGGMFLAFYGTFGNVIVNSYYNRMTGSKWKWIEERNLALNECKSTIESAFEDNLIEKAEVKELENNIQLFLKKAYGTRRYMNSNSYSIEEMSFIEYLKTMEVLHKNYGVYNERYGRNITFLYLMQRENKCLKRLEYVNNMNFYPVKKEKVKRYYESLSIFSSYLD